MPQTYKPYIQKLNVITFCLKVIQDLNDLPQATKKAQIVCLHLNLNEMLTRICFLHVRTIPKKSVFAKLYHA